jgi:heme exporter protein D
MTNSSKLFHFSDEFTAWAKQEDMINNQMNTNWIPAYVIITLVPIGFIAFAALASRKETKRKVSERQARAARIGKLLALQIWLCDMVAASRTNNNFTGGNWD